MGKYFPFSNNSTLVLRISFKVKIFLVAKSQQQLLYNGPDLIIRSPKT